jgi:aspartyl-tRNA(Asn)/glutamyl-tRNA(Gln) amidotransferase subunit A
MRVMAGGDPRDRASSGAPVPDYVDALTGDVRGLRVGLVTRFFLERSTPAVRAATEAAARHLTSLGAHVEEVTLPGVESTAAAYLAVVWTEALAYHQRWLQQRPGDYDPLVRDRLRMGLFLSGVDYVNGQRFRAHLRAETDALLARCDLLLTPAVPLAATPLGDDEVTINGERRDRRGALILFTQVFNMTGHPAISIPGGFDPDGLPIGLQLVGRAFDEATVLRAADAYQRTTDWHTRRPVD